MGLSKLGQYGVFVKEAWDVVFLIAKAGCVFHVAQNYLCAPALCEGPSMLPTIGLSGNVVLSEKISTQFGKVGHGDIVIVRSPANPRKFVAKRLVGMEGDTVSYLVDPKNSNKFETVVVPKGHIWIQGDNIRNSLDSRRFGAVPYGLLEGKVFWRVLPLELFGPLGKN